MKKVLAIIFSILFLSSCMFIELNLTIKDNYESAMRNKELNVVFESSRICSLANNDTIYAIKGNELKQCLNSIEKAIVYIWTPNCKNETCLSIGVVQDYCTINQYELFVVATDYDSEVFNAQIKPNRPLFSINHLYHGSNIFGESHTARFEKELTNNENFLGRFLEFKNGNYIGNKEIDKLIK